MARPTRLPIDALREFVTRQVAQHPRDLTRVIAAAFGVSRAAVAPVLRRLEGEGFLRRSSPGTRPSFEAGPSRLVSVQLSLPGIDESELWQQRFAPWLSLTDNVANIAHYVFTEMVNNANDHAQGSRLSLRAMQTIDTLYLAIDDDGVGAFRRIARALGLEDERLAVLELVKGKFTTDPARHTGEGVFFSSRAADAFLLRSNGLEYRRHEPRAVDRRSLMRLSELARPDGAGTVVVAALSLSNERPLRELFGAYTTRAPDDFGFDRTVLPVGLARVGNDQLVSRSQAKRLVARVERFRRVEFDFTGIDEIGQAFADELVRVFPSAHPGVEVVALNAAPPVLAMLLRAQPALRYNLPT